MAWKFGYINLNSSRRMLTEFVVDLDLITQPFGTQNYVDGKQWWFGIWNHVILAILNSVLSIIRIRFQKAISFIEPNHYSTSTVYTLYYCIDQTIIRSANGFQYNFEREVIEAVI